MVDASVHGTCDALSRYPNESQKAPIDIEGRHMETKTILIVDDEQDNLAMFSTILSKQHYSVMKATDGEACLKIAQETTPDLILLDVNMPKMDGFETIKQLRSIKKLTYTPIVFLTGFGKSPKSIDKGFLLGGDEYWTKPIAPEELIVRVRAVLRTADAEKKLRKLQQAFYSMVVHDLRNPIGAILGYSEILLAQQGSLDEEQQSFVTEMHTAGTALLRIIKDFLELSQFESGEYIIHRKHVPFSKLVQVVVAAQELKRNQKHITIDVEIDESLELNVDEEYFREVLDNLVDNALRFTPANGAIQISAKRGQGGDSSAQGFVSLKITDTGCGISSEAIASLFDKNRITNLKLRKAGSRTGLGLVICREIVEAHDGTISIESTIGKGTTVTIVLPG